MRIRLFGLALLASMVWGQQTVSIRFRAVAGAEEFTCGKTYPGIGITKSTITPRDFRFYVHNLRLIDEAGKEVPVELKQDDKWQLDDLALLDFEDGTGGCRNGTPDTNHQVHGTVPGGVRYRGLRFVLGVPFEKNHTDLTAMPSPLNLTALSWVWNSGRKFARLDFSSTGVPRGYAIHLGSTGCTPDDNENATPTKCAQPNREEIELQGFDPARDVVLADIASLLKDSDVDLAGKMMSGCMSGPNAPACKPLLANFGLAGQTQTFFRLGEARVATARR